MTILRSGNSLPGAATDLGIWYSARLAFRSRMLGSVDAPGPGFRPSVRWGCHGGILQTVGRSETLPSTPHITWLWSPGPAASCQSFGSASVLGGNTPPGPRGAGAEGHPGMLDRRPPRGLAELWAMCRILATEVHRRLISDCNGRQTDLASSFGRGLGSMSPPPCGRFRFRTLYRLAAGARSRLRTVNGSNAWRKPRPRASRLHSGGRGVRRPAAVCAWFVAVR